MARQLRKDSGWRGQVLPSGPLASGDPQRAFAVLSEGLPNGKYFCFDTAGAVLLVNHLPVRDALARAAKARGDLPAAIEAYRHLLTPSAESVWVSMLEPRNVLEYFRVLHIAEIIPLDHGVFRHPLQSHY